jgi:hypothetical protein
MKVEQSVQELAGVSQRTFPLRVADGDHGKLRLRRPVHLRLIQIIPPLTTFRDVILGRYQAVSCVYTFGCSVLKFSALYARAMNA